MNFSLLLKELREAITFRSLGSWFQRLLPLYFTDLNPEKRKKSRIDQVLTSACCPRQYEHIDIKKVANNLVTAILERCQKGQNFVVLLLLLLLFTRDFSELLQIQINIPLEPFRPTDVPLGGYKAETKDFGGIFLPQVDFWL